MRGRCGGKSSTGGGGASLAMTGTPSETESFARTAWKAAGGPVEAAGGGGGGGVGGGGSNIELAAALWRGVFREDPAVDSAVVVRLADYTRRELLSLLSQPREDVYRGWVTWGPAVGETAAERLERQRRMLAGEWREALHVDGRLYFYHTATHETRWTPPEEGLYERRRFALAKHLNPTAAALAAAGGQQGEDEAGGGRKSVQA